MTRDQDLNARDADRLAVLDRITDRVPELDLAPTSTWSGPRRRSSPATWAAL
jgi:hypothetical protein